MAQTSSSPVYDPEEDGYSPRGGRWKPQLTPGEGQDSGRSQTDLRVVPDSDKAEPPTAEQLQAAENLEVGSGLAKNETSASEGEAGSLFHQEKEKAKRSFLRGKARSSIKKGGKKKLLFGGLGLSGIACALLILFIFVGALKVVHFSQVLITSGYARLNGITQERITQDIFDSSVVEGPGSATIANRTLLDRLTFRNVELELAKIGRDGNFALINDAGGNTTGFRINNKTVDVNDIAKQLNFGNGSYANASARERLTIRKNFTDQAQNLIGDEFSTESRVIRSRATSIVADNVGFTWSRWRQALRDKFGADANPTDVTEADRIAQFEQVTNEGGVPTGIQQIDDIVKSAKDPARLKKILDKNGGEVDLKALADSLASDASNAATTGNIATTASVGALALSIACMANQTFAHVNDVAMGNEKQASLVALNLAAANSQIKAGDTTAGLVGSAASQLDGAEQTSSYLARIGETGGTPGNIPNVKPQFSQTIQQLLTTLTSPSHLIAGPLANAPGLGGISKIADDKFCGFILSPQGIITAGVGTIVLQAISGAFSGGAGAAAEQAGGLAVAKLLVSELASATWSTATDLVSLKSGLTIGGFTLYSLGLQYVATSLSGTAINGTVQGPDYWEEANLGTNIVQDRLVRANLYAKPLTPNEATAVDQNYQAVARSDWANKGVMQRYFAINNPYSLTGAFFAAMPTTFSGVVAKTSSMFASIGNVLNGALFKNILTPLFALVDNHRAFAATAASTYSPGVTEWGLSPDEVNKLNTDSSYSIGQNDSHITPAQIQTLDDTIGKQCYDPGLTQYQVSQNPACSEAALSTDLVFRYRVYKMDTNLVNAVTGNEGA